MSSPDNQIDLTSSPSTQMNNKNASENAIPIEAILLDMDGVLAEVSQSYRACILSTCHKHGAVSITYETISAWKAKGGCNNDWKLSYDLIQSDPNVSQSTKDAITLDKVTETFEEMYQGDKSKGIAGKYELETLIPTKALVESLYKKVNGKMAIVTGRPKKDCMKFLKDFDIIEYFPACVCMEDGPHKPHPFPVLEACRLLQVTPSLGVIMVGDTPDDITSAVKAGCRGIGVITPDAALKRKECGQDFDSCPMSHSMRLCSDGSYDIAIIRPGLEDLLNLF